MDRSRLMEHENHIMKCRKCGTEHKYFEAVAMMDSSELPGDLVWMHGCKKCGAIDYEEIN